MLRLAVLGRDVSRSLSPKIHTAAARALKLDIQYDAISCASAEDFNDAIETLRAQNARGANVTIPYKSDALKRSTVLAPTAKEIDAVNTLTFESDGTIEGDNTDGPGLAAILEQLPRERLEKVQLLGDGGAAKAAAWALAKAGAKQIVVSARSTGTLSAVPKATLVISTLPPDPQLRFQEYIDIAARPAILDVAYAAMGATPLVAFAKAHGLEASDGRAMLAEQGARSFQRWTGGDLSLIRAAMFSVLYSGTGDD